MRFFAVTRVDELIKKMSEALCCYLHLTAKVFVPPSFQIRGIAWRVRFSSTRLTTSSSIWRASTTYSDPVDTGLTWVSRGGGGSCNISDPVDTGLTWVCRGGCGSCNIPDLVDTGLTWVSRGGCGSCNISGGSSVF